MSGYKRVSFYDLCRLCASNSQKEKTHIFHEEGRKIQLQNKIQSCLALTVNEDDFLPKVVCSKCLRTLETCFGFRQECVRSESMLSTYFKNFRFTEDFKKSGKVYIKDIKPPTASAIVPQQNSEVSTSTNLLSAAQAIQQNVNVHSKTDPLEQVPLYTLHLPTIVSNPNINIKHQKDIDNNKINQTAQNQLAYNLNLLNNTGLRNSLPRAEILSNVVVNSNGEVINISNMGDFETILSQGSSILRNKTKPSKRSKEQRVQTCLPEENIVKIDLTEPDVSPVYNIDHSNVKYDKLPHIKTIPSKFSYAMKVDEKNQNPTVIFPISEYNQSFNSNPIYTQPSLNIVNTAANTNVICTNSASSVDASTININNLRNIDNSTMNMNALNQELPENGYTNVISNAASNVYDDTENDNKMNVPAADNNNSLKPSTGSTKTHVCEVCSRGFKRREHLYQHIKLHTGFRPYICEHCNKAFMRKEHLIRHSTLHSGQKNYTCNICEKSFSRNDNLLKHKKTHEKQSSYTCEVCQKQFVMKHYYNAHKMTHGDKCFVSTVWNMLKT